MKKLYYIIFIILIVLIFYCFFKSVIFYIDNKKIEVSFKETNSVSSFSNSDVILTYRNKYNNDDIIGILVINGLNINELVVKGVDNSYYLNHLVDGRVSVLGSLFMDYRSDFSSKQINIYGHNSRYYDVVFKRLEKYLDKDFYEDNRYISLISEDGVFTYEIFSISVTNSDDHLDFSSSFSDRIKYFKNNSLYDTGVSVLDDDYLLVLQTCIYNRDGDLLVISAKRVNFQESDLMKKFLFIGFISFFAFFNTTYAVDYRKNVDDYSINEVFSSEVLANEKKDDVVKKLEEIRKNVLKTGGFYSYDVKVNPVLSDDKVTKVFNSFDEYKSNFSLYDDYKNVFFTIKLSERFKDRDSLDKRISFLKDEFDDFSYEVSNDYEYSLKSIDVVKKTLKDAEDVVNDFKSKYEEVTGGITKVRNKSLDEVIISNEIKDSFDNYDDALRLKNSLVSNDEYEISSDISKESREVETSREDVSKVFKSLKEAEDYISDLKSKGYDVSGLKTELQSFMESVWSVDSSVIVNPGTVDGKVFNYGHFDIVLVNDFVKIDKDGNKSNVRGNIVINKVVVKNGDNSKNIKMNNPSRDPNGGYYEYTSQKRQGLNITNKSLVTISGNVLYNGISLPFTISGYLSESCNVCGGRGSSKGFDLKFKSVTIKDDKVIIDTKLVSNYKVSGTIFKKENKDFYVVRYTKTKKGYDYKVCLNGKERSLVYVLNGNINIERKVYDYVLSGYGRGYMLYGDVLVKYVDRDGKEIAKNDYFYDRVNNSYSTKPKDLKSKGYVYSGLYSVSKDDYDTDGKFINDRIVISYIYDKDSVHAVQTGVSVNNGYLIPLGVSFLGLVLLVFLKRRFSQDLGPFFDSLIFFIFI